MNAIIHYEVILNIALIVLVVCLAAYTFTQDMRLKKYKMLLSDMQSGNHWHHSKQSKIPASDSRLAA